MVSALKRIFGPFCIIAILAPISTIGITHADPSSPPKGQTESKSVEPAPLTRLGDKHSDLQSLVVNNNLTLREFLTALASPSHPERHYAEMYLVGVLDTTEGTDWCGYDVVLPDSAASVMYTEAKKQLDKHGGERASKVIRGILRDMASCRSKK